MSTLTPSGPVTAVLLDLDGTLIDSGPTIRDAFTYAYERLGLPVPDDDALDALIGPPLREGLRSGTGLDGDALDEAVRLYRSRYTRHMHEAPVYDGVAGLLHALRRAGVPTALATSKRQDLAVRILEHHGLACLLTAVCGADDGEHGGRKADVVTTAVRRLAEADAGTSRVVHVGDRRHDVEGAHEAGVECVGVLWGYGDEEELAGAEWLVRTPADLGRLLSGLTGTVLTPGSPRAAGSPHSARTPETPQDVDNTEVQV